MNVAELNSCRHTARITFSCAAAKPEMISVERAAMLAPVARTTPPQIPDRLFQAAQPK